MATGGTRAISGSAAGAGFSPSSCIENLETQRVSLRARPAKFLFVSFLLALTAAGLSRLSSFSSYSLNGASVLCTAAALMYFVKQKKQDKALKYEIAMEQLYRIEQSLSMGLTSEYLASVDEHFSISDIFVDQAQGEPLGDRTILLEVLKERFPGTFSLSFTPSDSAQTPIRFRLFDKRSSLKRMVESTFGRPPDAPSNSTFSFTIRYEGKGVSQASGKGSRSGSEVFPLEVAVLTILCRCLRNFAEENPL